MSAGDLVWSYASLVTANAARVAFNPTATMAELNRGSTVLQELLVSDYDLPADSSKPVLRVVGNTESLGNGDACASNFADRTPTVRRCTSSTGACDYTLLVEVPKLTEVQWTVVRTDEACTSFEFSPAGNTTISATNNGVVISAATWTQASI